MQIDIDLRDSKTKQCTKEGKRPKFTNHNNSGQTTLTRMIGFMDIEETEIFTLDITICYI